MHIARLHHAQVTIPTGQEDRARRFYCDLLGLREIDKPEPLKPRGGFWLQLGDVQIHIGAEDGVDRAASKAHLAYQVADLAAWRARFEREGIDIKDGTRIVGQRRFSIRDPFGNRLEFLQLVSDG